MRIPTVTIDRDGTAVVINRSDFRPGVDRVWGADEPAPRVPAPAPKRDDNPADEIADEKDDLIAKLAALGIDKNRRSSVETLRHALAEAEAAK